MNLLGFTLHRMENGESELHYTPKPEHLNSHGVTHERTDDAAGCGAVRGGAQRYAGAWHRHHRDEIHLHGSREGPLVAKARRIRRTRTMAFVEGWVYDESGEMCTMATARSVMSSARSSRRSPPIDDSREQHIDMTLKMQWTEAV